MARSRHRFYGEKPRPEGAEARPPDLDLDGAARLDDLEEEITLLRALIKRAVQQDLDGEARRQVQALCGALRLQRILTGRPADAGLKTIDEILDEIEQEEAAGALAGVGR